MIRRRHCHCHRHRHCHQHRHCHRRRHPHRHRHPLPYQVIISLIDSNSSLSSPSIPLC